MNHILFEKEKAEEMNFLKTHKYTYMYITGSNCKKSRPFKMNRDLKFDANYF